MQRFMTQAAEVFRATVVDDGAGFETQTWAKVFEIKGRLDAISGSESRYAEKLTRDSTHVWICLPFADVLLETDRIFVDGKEYRIVFFDDPMNFGRHYEIELKRWEADNV